MANKFIAKFTPIATYTESKQECPKDLSWAWDTSKPIYECVETFNGRSVNAYGLLETWKANLNTKLKYTIGGDFTRLKMSGRWAYQA